MLNRIAAVAVCDATVLKRYSAAGYINLKLFVKIGFII
jgi:hypothetical protein